MPDELEGRRARFNPATRSKFDAKEGQRLFNVLDEAISKNLPFGKVEGGQGFMEAVRKTPAAFRRKLAGFATSKGMTFLADGIKRTIRGAGALGPPDVRKSTKRTMISKRKPGQFGGAGR